MKPKPAHATAHYSRPRTRRLRESAVGRLQFESFLLELATAFVKIEADAVDREMGIWLGRLVSFMGMDRAGLWEYAEDRTALRCRYWRPSRESTNPPPDFQCTQFPWLMKQYRHGNVVKWESIPEDIPPEAVAEREYARSRGLKSLLAIPLIDGPSLCVMAFASIREPMAWPPALIGRLRLVGEIFASAILRCRAELSLRASESRFRGAFDRSAIGIALVSPRGNWLEVNSALCRILGYSEAELLATTFQALTFPDDLASDLGYLERVLAGEINHYELEKRYVAKDGRIVWALLTVSVVREETGRVLYFVSQVQDLSEQKNNHLAIERMRRELAHVGRVALMGQLTASLAHEVLQPITSIVSNAEAGLRLAESAWRSNPQLPAILQDIAQGADRAARIVHSVRDMLRKERRTRELVNLNDIVRQVGDVVRADLALRGVRLTIRLDPRVPQINADAVELQQVVLNLVLNAADAMEDVSSKAPVEVTTTANVDEIVLRVTDHGRGLDPMHLRRIFEPFFTTKPDGIGVGLSICAEIVRSHGGRLWAENNAGAGLTLHCVLPGPANTT